MPSIFNHSVELRHLRYFCAVAEAGSVTRAAASIGLRQPTLSQQLQQLEKSLGTLLFQRSRTHCKLTAAGELLLPYARRVLGEMESLRQALDDLTDLRRGSLTLAMLPLAAEGALPLALSRFHRAHPGIQVRALSMTVDEMARSLANGAIDLCIGASNTNSHVGDAVLLFREELVALFPLRDGKTQPTVLPFSELEGIPLILPPPGYGTRTLILQAWAKVRRQPQISLEVTSVDAVLRAVAEGGGIGILPASALWGAGTGPWQVVRLHRPTLQREVALWQGRMGDGRPAANAFIPFLQDAVRILAQESAVAAVDAA